MRALRLGGVEPLEIVDRPLTVRRPALAGRYSAADDFDAFYRREFAQLLVLARVLAGSQVAEDVVQETMLVAYRWWDEVRSLASPVRWVRGVCMHKAVSVVRRRSVEQRLLRQLGSFRRPPADAVGDDERFWALVRVLPRRQAQVIVLHYVLDLGVAEIAETLGCAEGTVKVHLSRARTALATALAVAEGDGSSASTRSCGRRPPRRTGQSVGPTSTRRCTPSTRRGDADDALGSRPRRSHSPARSWPAAWPSGPTRHRPPLSTRLPPPDPATTRRAPIPLRSRGGRAPTTGATRWRSAASARTPSSSTGGCAIP